jgi:hypothetical protein
MAKIPRITQKPFGSAAPAAGQFITFGSLAAGTPVYSKDLTAIQSLAAWTLGWSAATVGNKSPSLEDMNALFLTAFQQIGCLLQSGIPEWDAGTDYYIGGKCRIADEVYTSLIDSNLNNNPATDTNNWESDTIRNFKKQYPIGEVFTTHRTGDPSTLLGFGTWTRIAAGRMPVMLNPADADFDTIGKQGGEKTHTLTIDEIPPIPTAPTRNGTAGANPIWANDATIGGGQPHNNMPPYEVLFNAWLRTA